MNITERIEAARKPPEREEPQHKIVTVRMSCDRHAAIKELAHKQRVSMNQFCLIALDQAADELSVGPQQENEG